MTDYRRERIHKWLDSQYWSDIQDMDDFERLLMRFEEFLIEEEARRMRD